jgi:hypothetical protein
MARSARSLRLSADAITVEGALIAPAMLARIATQPDNADTRAEYRIPKGLTLRDEIARYFRIGQALFTELFASPTPPTTRTIGFVEALFRDVFGFADIARIGLRTLEDRPYAVTLEALGGRAPVVVVPPSDDKLDRASDHLPGDGHRRSAASAVQDWLNACEDATWGFCCNGEQLRLLRDNANLTRPAYIEADLRHIFEAESFADFTALWLLIHASRFGQLLRLVYRLIFLLAAEDRSLLHPPDASPAVRLLYAQGYSLASLRDRAIRRTAWDAHHDKWEGVAIVFAALAIGEPRLGLPALGGLFVPEMTPDLDTAHLPNRALMEAIFRLAWLREDAALLPVNWRDMETEELGSVYESLLELTPPLTDNGRGFGFAEGGETRGHARKTSGSYYTPDALVQALLDSALDPVLGRVEAEADDPAAALLGVTMIDPACGSGHFLLAAGRRIATRLARARTGGVASAEDYRHALRDVARACLHGVDRNPMAVELTKVALWIETVEPGKPLGFLDANIRCGDALLGVFDMKALDGGIPDAAYKPLTGDDRETARYYLTRNRNELRGQGSFDFVGGGNLPTAPLARAWAGLRTLPEDSPEQVAEKRRRFEAARADRLSFARGEAADLYIAAFLLPKSGEPPVLGAAPIVPTSGDVWRALADRQVNPPLVARAVEASRQAHAFHWPLEFPDVMAAGGFDIVLGNPPWERIKLQEQEFFATLDPEIADAPNAAARGRLIAGLSKSQPGSRERILYGRYELAKRIVEASSIFARESGRFPLTGTGDVNTYGLFGELFWMMLSSRGYSGIIVPTDILSGDALKGFFQRIVDAGALRYSIGFENEEFLFPGIANVNRFALVTLGPEDPGQEIFTFAFYLRQAEHMADRRRFFALDKSDFRLLNPNSRTCPVFRSQADAELTKQIYQRIPVLIDESGGDGANPWQVSFMRMFDMANDSGLFLTAAQIESKGYQRSNNLWQDGKGAIAYLPLYEGKFIWHFDHRFSSYHNLGKAKGRGGRGLPPVTLAEYTDCQFEIEPRYWVTKRAIDERLANVTWEHDWLAGWRDVTSAKLERTFVSTIIPRVPAGHKLPIFFVSCELGKFPAFLGITNSIVFDYFVRQKFAGTSMTQHYFKQFPVLPPSAFSDRDLAYLTPRIVELTYTSYAMVPFARDFGFEGAPFVWNEDRRALLRAELDAFYARAYGLTRDELRYILDPEDAMGAGYPSETFRVLKTNEIRRFGEYRTARLVLAAWDTQEAESRAACVAGS